MHDVGKVGVPDNVLLKLGKLTDEEFELVKGHAEIGAEPLSIAEKQLGSSSFLRVAKEIALTHHEKWGEVAIQTNFLVKQFRSPAN